MHDIDSSPFGEYDICTLHLVPSFGLSASSHGFGLSYAAEKRVLCPPELSHGNAKIVVDLV